MQMTLRKTQAALRAHGLVLTKKDGEYRVNFYKGAEGTAYYTNDLHDAALTGMQMVKERAAMQGSRRRHGNTARTRLDALLDRVTPRHEVTIDADGYTKTQIARIYAAARARGLHVSGTHRWILIRVKPQASRRRYANSRVGGGWGIYDVGRKKWMHNPLRAPVDMSPARFATKSEADRAADRDWRKLNPGSKFVARRLPAHADSRTGTPMYRSAQHASMFVTIEYLDGRPLEIKHWRGTSGKAIQKAARARYKGIAKLSFGRVMYHHGPYRP